MTANSTTLAEINLIKGYTIISIFRVTGFYFALAAQLKVEGRMWWRRSFVRNLLVLLRRWGRGLARLARVCYSSGRKTWRRFVDLLPLSWQWILWALVMVAALVLAVLSKQLWAIIAALVFVAASFFYALHAFKILYDGAKRMSRGDLKTPVDKDQLMGGFAEFATQLNALADVAVVAAQKQMRSERMRAELITNVSHDIKTPLTSIINYSDLIGKEPCENETITEYAAVLHRQSERLKRLIDDLVEASKASTGNLEVLLAPCEVGVMLTQTVGEYEQRLKEKDLELITKQPEAPIKILADGRRLWRVFDNLMNNVCKYAQRGTRVYLTLEEQNGHVIISFKNISREPLNLSSDELMERFVQGDTSRNSDGNGLGLSIAKSLTELQNGTMELTTDGDLFKVVLHFPTIS